MEFGEKDVKKISILLLAAVLIVLAFIVVQPFIISAISGLILAYIFMPVYRKINYYVKNKSAAAFILVMLILVCIFAALWFAAPVMIKQTFDLFLTVQKIDMQKFVHTLFPTASSDFVTQMTVTLNNISSKAFSASANALSSFLTNLPKFLLDLFILGFIFFYGMRDAEQLKAFVKGISPLSESKEKIVVNHFKNMTGAILYGWVVVGVIQGLLAGIGFFIFGVKSALILTVIAIFLSIIPFLGPAFVWVPVGIYLIATTNNAGMIIGYFLYNLLIVSLVDNIIRSYIISKRTEVSPAVILLGMLGGIFMFGVTGIVIGPLVLAYLLTLLESFRDKSIYTLFS